MDAHPPEDEQGTEVKAVARLLPAPPVPELNDDRLRELRGCVREEIRSRRPRRRRRLIAVAAALGAAAAVFAGVSLGTDSASHRPPAQKPLLPSPLSSTVATPTPFVYPTNANGQTYGGNHEGTQEPDLVAVSATRGKSGYSWWTDLNGPMPASLEEAAWIGAESDKRQGVAVYESDGVTQVGVFISGEGGVDKRPPVWLFDQMKNLASNAGDANAWAWWTLTTAEKAAAATGNSTTEMTDPERPVYLAILLGDFTKWLWSLPEGTSAPEYSWIYEVIDGDSHEVDGSGASAKPFDAAEGLDLNLVGLRDRIRM